MVKNIVFDIGNVLTDFRYKDFLMDKGFDMEMIGRIAKASVESPYWKEIDRGEWEAEALMEKFIELDPEIEVQLRMAYEDIHGMVSPRDYAIPWIKSLKEKGFGVYYLSNFSDKAYVECADALEFIPYTDGGILSYRERLIKPDPTIYKLLLERYGLKADECVFLDDLVENVEAARSMGFWGIVFQSREQAERELADLGVKCEGNEV